MELNEFLEKFLPEYEQKDKIRCQRISNLFKCGSMPEESRIHNQNSIDRTFDEINFPEALQNFADIICEKQRENCLKNTYNANSHLTYMNGINKAERPKIDKL